MSFVLLTLGTVILAVGTLFVASTRGRRWGWVTVLLPMSAVVPALLLMLWNLDGLTTLLVAVVSVPAVGLWSLAVRWARREPVPPLLDQARLRWSPRATHRPVWVLFASVALLWTVLNLAFGSPCAVVVPLIALGVCWRFAHHGERGPLRIESRDLVLDNQRIPLDDIVQVEREVRVFPMWRIRLVIHRREGRPLKLLATGSPDEHVDAVVRVLSQQHAYALDHQVDRGEEIAPPRALESLLGQAER